MIHSLTHGERSPRAGLLDDLLGAGDDAFGDVDAHILGRSRLDVKLGLLDALDGDVARVFALQHAEHDPPGLPADVVIVEADGGYRTARHRIRIAGIDRDVVVLADPDDRLQGRDDRVV